MENKTVPLYLQFAAIFGLAAIAGVMSYVGHPLDAATASVFIGTGLGLSAKAVSTTMAVGNAAGASAAAQPKFDAKAAETVAAKAVEAYIASSKAAS